MTRDEKVKLVFLIAIFVATICFRKAFGGTNFQPVGALALFSGAVVGQLSLALIVPIAAMLIGDSMIGIHWPTAAVVYSSYLLIVLLSRWLIVGWRSKTAQLPAVANDRLAAQSAFRIGGTALMGACLFYVITNLGAWQMLPMMYERSVSGLLACYVSAIPYFRNALLGDVVFGALYFSAYAWLHVSVLQKSPAALTENRSV